MRKVLFKSWVPVKYQDAVNGVSRPVEGTGCWGKDFDNTGIFHQWANAFEESSAGFGNYTVALVELADGTIESVLPQNIKFVAEQLS